MSINQSYYDVTETKFIPEKEKNDYLNAISVGTKKIFNTLGTVAYKTCDTVVTVDWKGVANQAAESFGIVENVDYIEKFKKENTVQKRKQVRETLNKKFPDMVMVIISKSSAQKSALCGDLRKHKLLANRDSCVSNFTINLVKNHLRGLLAPQTSIFLLVSYHNTNVILTPSMLMSEVEKKYKDPEDGILYITYIAENTFG